MKTYRHARPPVLDEHQRGNAMVAWVCIALTGLLLLVLANFYGNEIGAMATKVLKFMGGVVALSGLIALSLIRDAKLAQKR